MPKHAGNRGSGRAAGASPCGSKAVLLAAVRLVTRWGVAEGVATRGASSCFSAFQVGACPAEAGPGFGVWPGKTVANLIAACALTTLLRAGRESFPLLRVWKRCAKGLIPLCGSPGRRSAGAGLIRSRKRMNKNQRRFGTCWVGSSQTRKSETGLGVVTGQHHAKTFYMEPELLSFRGS